MALPPVGSAKTFSQTRHLTTVAALLNIICSFLHLEHLTFRNFESGSRFFIFNHNNIFLFQNVGKKCPFKDNFIAFTSLNKDLSIWFKSVVVKQAFSKSLTKTCKCDKRSQIRVFDQN